MSRERDLLATWPASGPRQLWLSRDVGLGYSGPAVVGNQLLIMGTRDEREWLMSIDASTGKLSWSAEIGPLYENDYGDGPRGTPTVDGDRVYALGGQGTLVCVALADGQVRWQRTMQELGGRAPEWGFSESPLVDGNQLVCTPGGDQGALAALDKMTGKEIWRSKEFTDGAQYASIVVGDPHGTRQYIQLTMKHVVGIRAEDGQLLWQADWPGRTAVVPTPIYGNGHVYVTAGYGAGCKLLKIESDNNVTEVYSNLEMQNQHGGVILVGDFLYGYSDKGGWICQEFLTGETVWRERRKLGKGAVAYADGKLYCISEREGTVALLAASADSFRELSRFTLEPQTELRRPQGRIWTHPVIAGGRMYLRDQELLFCFDVKGK